MNTIPLEKAQANLSEVIDHLKPGEELVIVRGEKPIAKLISEKSPEGRPREPGKGKGHILYMAEDFDSPLDDFQEYME